MGFYRLLNRLLNKKAWKDFEYFDESWKTRIKSMAKYIQPNTSVIDLGCGKMWLKEYIGKNINYYPVDYLKRAEDSIVCDFNKLQFPKISAECSFVSGCLEYVDNPAWFINKITQNSNKCIISYCTFDDFPNINERKKLGWVNSLNENELISLFKKNNFELLKSESTELNHKFYIFNRCQ